MRPEKTSGSAVGRGFDSPHLHNTPFIVAITTLCPHGGYVMGTCSAMLRHRAAVHRATSDTVDIPGCPGWTLNGPSQPTAGFVASISYSGREIARAYSDDANPMSIHFYPTPREIVNLNDFTWIIKMVRQGILLRLDSEFNYWLANCECSSYPFDFDPGVGVTIPATA